MSINIKPVHPSQPALHMDLDGFESFSGGVGGWESLDRPRRASAAAWVGLPARTVDIPVLLDGMEALGPGRDRPVEADCKTLERWGVEHRKAGHPPILRVRGLTTISPKERWVVQDLSWGEYVVDDRQRRIQQQVTITLLEYREATITKGPAAKARHRHKHKKGGK